MTPSKYEQFFQGASFAVVGDTKRKPFPVLTYDGLKTMGKSVYPVDLGGAPTIRGDAAFSSVSALPRPVDAAIVEVPRDETLAAVKQLSNAGIKRVWLHQNSDTPAVLDYCRDNGIDACHGTCAVMYTGAGSYHRIHRGLAKLFRKY